MGDGVAFKKETSFHSFPAPLSFDDAIKLSAGQRDFPNMDFLLDNVKAAKNSHAMAIYKDYKNAQVLLSVLEFLQDYGNQLRDGGDASMLLGNPVIASLPPSLQKKVMDSVRDMPSLQIEKVSMMLSDHPELLGRLRKSISAVELMLNTLSEMYMVFETGLSGFDTVSEESKARFQKFGGVLMAVFGFIPSAVMDGYSEAKSRFKDGVGGAEEMWNSRWKNFSDMFDAVSDFDQSLLSFSGSTVSYAQSLFSSDTRQLNAAWSSQSTAYDWINRAGKGASRKFASLGDYERTLRADMQVAGTITDNFMISMASVIGTTAAFAYAPKFLGMAYNAFKASKTAGAVSSATGAALDTIKAHKVYKYGKSAYGAVKASKTGQLVSDSAEKGVDMAAKVGKTGLGRLGVQVAKFVGKRAANQMTFSSMAMNASFAFAFNVSEYSAAYRDYLEGKGRFSPIAGAFLKDWAVFTKDMVVFDIFLGGAWKVFSLPLRGVGSQKALEILISMHPEQKVMRILESYGLKIADGKAGEAQMAAILKIVCSGQKDRTPEAIQIALNEVFGNVDFAAAKKIASYMDESWSLSRSLLAPTIAKVDKYIRRISDSTGVPYDILRQSGLIGTFAAGSSAYMFSEGFITEWDRLEKMRNAPEPKGFDHKSAMDKGKAISLWGALFVIDPGVYFKYGGEPDDLSLGVDELIVPEAAYSDLSAELGLKPSEDPFVSVFRAISAYRKDRKAVNEPLASLFRQIGDDGMDYLERCLRDAGITGD
ncbi:MAG: hypothetical protein ACP5NX_04510 [Candidatus Bilamarchaeaceae archaeon]